MKMTEIPPRFNRGGPGLSLSIAQWIARAHHGQIRIASAENRTTVTIPLPLASGETIS
jgi:signal transduction histidine kinase